MKQLRRQVKIR